MKVSNNPPEKLSPGGELPGTCKAWRALHASHILTYANWLVKSRLKKDISELEKEGKKNADGKAKRNQHDKKKKR